VSSIIRREFTALWFFGARPFRRGTTAIILFWVDWTRASRYGKGKGLKIFGKLHWPN